MFIFCKIYISGARRSRRCSASIEDQGSKIEDRGSKGTYKLTRCGLCECLISVFIISAMHVMNGEC